MTTTQPIPKCSECGSYELTGLSHDRYLCQECGHYEDSDSPYPLFRALGLCLLFSIPFWIVLAMLVGWRP